MKRLDSERGVALVIVLILAAVSLITVAGLFYMLGRGGFVSGQQKRFRTALEAGKAGAWIAFQVVEDRGTTDNTLLPNFSLAAGLATKLSQSTPSWGALDNSVTIDPSDATTYDIRFDLGEHRVYGKVVDTVVGNSGVDTGLLKTAVVNTGSGEVTVMGVPYLYTIEELAQSQTNPSERAKLSILYEF